MTSNGKRRWSRWERAGWLAVAISVGGVIYLLAWYVPDFLARRSNTSASATVLSAWISAVAILLGVGATAAVAIFAFSYARKTNQATIDAANENLKDQREQLDKTFTEQREQLNTTLAAQREQLDSTLAEQRIRTLNERFATAAGQLGSDKPAAVRLAGVYAIAGLADDWDKKENRQTCVDVLCGYLRMPYESDPGEQAPVPERLAFRASREVRHTVIRVITEHLKDDAAVSWQGLNFDFTGVVFDGGSFRGAEFSRSKVGFRGAEFSSGTVDFSGAEFFGGTVSFSGAKFSGGTVSFSGARFSGGTVDFSAASFSGGEVDFDLAEFSGATVDFTAASFSGGAVHFGAEFSDLGAAISDHLGAEFSDFHDKASGGAKFSGGTVDFTAASFSGGAVDFGAASFSGGEVDFDLAEFSGGTVHFGAASLSGGTVNFREAFFSGGTVDFRAKFSGGTVDFGGARFSGGAVDFRAKFSGGTVDFGGARFSGGTVDFRGAEFSGATVDFTAASFSGGTVDFGEIADWSHPPTFNRDNPPTTAVVKLPTRKPSEFL